MRKVTLTEMEIASLYQENTIEVPMVENEYLIVESEILRENPLVFKKRGDKLAEVDYQVLNSKMFGKLKPRDAYQLAYIDSLNNNDITFCIGGAGSGKSLLALAKAFSMLENNEIDKIVFFNNTVPARGAEQIGYLPGDEVTKLMGSSVGLVLASKLGNLGYAEGLVRTGKIQLVPIALARGYETGPRSFVYVTEAQNFSRYLMKLLLQRIAEGSKVVIEGDYRQADRNIFEGENNGLAAAIEAFKGQDFSGEIELQTIYRSRIATIAEGIVGQKKIL